MWHNQERYILSAVRGVGYSAACTDKDCLTDLQVFFTDQAQPIIDSAVSIKCKDIEIIDVILDVEPVAFNKGFYSVDLSFFFEVTVNVYTSPTLPATTLTGAAAFSKKCILYGSDGNVRVFSSTDTRRSPEEMANSDMPKASVHVVDPMILDCKIVECVTGRMIDTGVSLPSWVNNRFEGDFAAVRPRKVVLITVGLFTIVQLERSVQMLIPAYDYAIPDKEGCTNTDDPCEIFKKIKFPVNQFFPPKLSDNA